MDRKSLPAKLTAIALMLALGVALAACGGGSSGPKSASGDTLSARDAETVANNFFLTFFGAMTGSKSSGDVLNLFTQDCRKGVDQKSLDSLFALIKVFAPELSKAKIEAFDVGALDVKQTSAGTEITPKDPSKARVRLNGKWVGLDQLGSELGMKDSTSSFGPTADDQPLVVQRESGKWLISDCDSLKDFSGDSGPSISVSTPSASRPSNAPGSDRTKPISYGQSADVEKQWRLTIGKVNRDAWPVIKANSTFADQPAANERLVLIEVVAKNIGTGNKAQNIGDFSLRITGSRNQLYSSYDGKHDCGPVPNELDADLFPGGETRGNVCYKVPSDETSLLLVWQSFMGGDATYFDLGN